MHYLIHKLLPMLKKINREQGIELERESEVTCIVILESHHGVMAISQSTNTVQKVSENPALDAKLGMESCSISCL